MPGLVAGTAGHKGTFICLQPESADRVRGKRGIIFGDPDPDAGDGERPGGRGPLRADDGRRQGAAREPPARPPCAHLPARPAGAARRRRHGPGPLPVHGPPARLRTTGSGGPCTEPLHRAARPGRTCRRYGPRSARRGKDVPASTAGLRRVSHPVVREEGQGRPGFDRRLAPCVASRGPRGGARTSRLRPPACAVCRIPGSARRGKDVPASTAGLRRVSHPVVREEGQGRPGFDRRLAPCVASRDPRGGSKDVPASTTGLRLHRVPRSARRSRDAPGTSRRYPDAPIDARGPACASPVHHGAGITGRRGSAHASPAAPPGEVAVAGIAHLAARQGLHHLRGAEAHRPVAPLLLERYRIAAHHPVQAVHADAAVDDGQ